MKSAAARYEEDESPPQFLKSGVISERAVRSVYVCVCEREGAVLEDL